MFGMLGFLNFLDCNFDIGDAEDGGGGCDDDRSPLLLLLPLEEVSRDNDFLAEANFFGSFGAMMLIYDLCCMLSVVGGIAKETFN